MNKQINKIMNKRKNNPEALNDKQKFNPPLEMSTTAPTPLIPSTTLKLPTTPNKGILILDSV